MAVLTGAAVWLLFHTSGSVAIDPPRTTSGAVAAGCAALGRVLPQAVDGQTRRTADPPSASTAAWGSPAITLRCGVGEPSILVPGTKNYDPTADEAYLDGVAWLIEQTPTGYRFTAVQRAIYVEVYVPATYNPETYAAADLSAPVIEAIPRSDGKTGADVAPYPTPTS